MLPVESTRNIPLVLGLDELEERGTLLLDTIALDEELRTLLLATIALDEERGTLLLDSTIELDEELRILLDTTELDELGNELERTELLTTLELVQAPVTPNGDGWLAQVALEIQLLLFS